MAMPEGIGIIDCWVGLTVPAGGPPPGPTSAGLDVRDEGSRTGSVTGYLFGKESAERAGNTPEAVIKVMDEAGIEKGILKVPADNPEQWVKVIDKYPDRYIGGASVDPRQGIEAVRQLERLVKEHGFKCAKISAMGSKPYNDKIYFPIYAKCIELDIPITANVGIPGPRVPGESQNPIYFDEVCWFFPELKVVMTHGGEPWSFTCVKLMLKWPNLYMMSSAFAPKHYPQEIVYYANTRGADKVMFASDHPLVSIERCKEELPGLPLRDHVWPKFLRENAMKVFKL